MLLTNTYINLVLSSFHQDAMKQMLGYARDEAKKLNLIINQEFWVPGAMELPLCTSRAASTSISGASTRGVVVLGIIEKGETAHGLVMAQSVVSALIRLQLELSMPMGIGILGPEISAEQIPPRLEPYARKAVAALHAMIKQIA